jgi:outer membrane protein OmpA-like peptidoglycan-associated protein
MKARLLESEKTIRQLQKDLAEKTQRLAESETALTKPQARKPSMEAATMNPPLSASKNEIDPVYDYLPQKKLNASYERVLESLRPVLALKPDTVIRLTGHSNQEGSEDASLKMSAQRAESLAAYLTKRGVPRHSLQVVAAGSLHPLFPSASAEGRKLNRRVEVEILK